MSVIRRLLDDERVRFLLVGGINTVVGYVLFALFELSFGKSLGTLGSLLSLYASYIVAIFLAFVLHRRFTFRATGTGSVVIDFLRFSSVYVVSLAVNTVLLAVLVGVFHFESLLSQAAIVVVTTLISYFGHKWFSFRRPAAVEPSDLPGPD